MISEIIRSAYLSKKQGKKQSPKIDFLATVKRPFRVGLRDIDFNIHINNARYLVFMEKARWDHSVQTGIFNTLFKNKINFIVAGIEIGYIREIRLFTRFNVETTYLGWDEKYFYMEQRCVVKGKLHGYALIKSAFTQKGKVITPEQVMEYIPSENRPENLPEHMQIWKDLAAAKRRYSAA